jgi:hypothetical protein
MPATHHRIPQRLAGVVLILLLVALALLRSQHGTRLDGYTVDEPWHIVAGVSYLRTGDFRLNPEHPPLSKLAVALAIPDDFKLRPLAPLEEKSQERELVEETMYFDNDSPGTQAAARMGMWAFHGVLLVLLGLALWQTFGLAWATGTLAFLAIEPTIGAHLPVVMTDLPLALCFGLAAVTAGLLASQWRWRWVLACGVAVGLALGSKHSALAGVAGIAMVLAIAALMGFRDGGVRTVAKRSAQLVLAATLSLVVLWAQYGFHFNAGPDGSDGYNRAMPDKISDLNIPHWREGIAFADRHHLLPRAYLWGLADTVRAGVEGRGANQHLVWGTKYKGHAPWFTWPSFMAAKLPLALMALSLLGLALLPRLQLTPSARWVLAALLGGSAAHLLALMGSQGTYGGIRHALPLVVTLAIVAGAAVAWACQSKSRAGMAAVAVLLVAALGMTIREPRLWEYHNELAGGSAQAYRYFGNEGLDLGQRFPEMRAFHDRVIKPEKAQMFSGYWFGEEQAIAARMNYRRRILGMDDNNVAGLYEGYFFESMSDTLPEPDWGWDPEVTYKDTEVVARLGYVMVRRGKVVDPLGRAGSMYHAVRVYLHQKGGTDYALAAKRLEEVVQMVPAHLGAAVELGNLYLRLDNAHAARLAYARPLAQEKLPVEPLVRAQLQAQLASLDSTTDVTRLKPLRNPWME